MSKKHCPERSAKGSEIVIKRSVDENWRKNRTSSQCLSHLYLSEHLSDVSFTFADDKSVKLPAHKFVLSMRSSVFETMFYGSLPEGDTISVADISPDIMKVALQFIYSDNPDIDANNVFDCLYTARKYDLTGLEQQCEEYLQNKTDEENVITVYDKAVFYEIKGLQQHCIHYIFANAKNVLSSREFVKTSHELLLKILESDELAYDEIEIFKAAMKWAEHQCEENKKVKDGQNMREQLGEALFEIRFPIMPIDGFARFVTPSAILTKDELLMLYPYIATKLSSSLGKFKNQERLAINVKKVDFTTMLTTDPIKNGYEIGHYRLRLVRNFSDDQRKRKNIKIKSLTGTFAQIVTEINVNRTKITEYEIESNNIAFHNPFDFSDDIVIEFSVDNSKIVPGVFSFQITYNTSKAVNIDGEIITVKSIPKGLEEVNFVCS